jgi:hypothetical protein
MLACVTAVQQERKPMSALREALSPATGLTLTSSYDTALPLFSALPHKAHRGQGGNISSDGSTECSNAGV